MHGVEGLGLPLRHVNALLRDDAQPRRLDLGVDRAGEIALGGVGLEDREGALLGHGAGRLCVTRDESRALIATRRGGGKRGLNRRGLRRARLESQYLRSGGKASIHRDNPRAMRSGDCEMERVSGAQACV